MKHTAISASVVLLTLTCLLALPDSALTWCQAMGGYPSYAAQARALSAQRAAAGRQATATSSQRSTQVMTDQKALAGLGYYRGDVDGLAGPATRSAITDFRKANNLGAGTTLDSSSRSILNSGKAVSKAAWKSASTR